MGITVQRLSSKAIRSASSRTLNIRGTHLLRQSVGGSPTASRAATPPLLPISPWVPTAGSTQGRRSCTQNQGPRNSSITWRALNVPGHFFVTNPCKGWGRRSGVPAEPTSTPPGLTQPWSFNKVSLIDSSYPEALSCCPALKVRLLSAQNAEL